MGNVIQNNRSLITYESEVVDLAGRISTSEPYNIFESKMVNDKQPLYWDEVVNGTATSTHNLGEASVSMAVLASGDYVIRQTKMRFGYQASKVQEVFLTGVPTEPVANTEMKYGYFNTSTVSPYTADADGIYFGHDGTDKYVAISRDGTEHTKKIQTEWNLDTMNGSGPSGKTFNWDENQLLYIQFLWLGIDTVRWGCKIDGELIWFHQENMENGGNASFGSTGAYMATPNHSLRMEVRSTGGTITAKQICGAVNSLGGVEPAGVTRAVDNGITSVTCGTALEGILFFRVNANRPCTPLDLSFFSILNSSNNASNYRWAIVLNPTIGGTAPTFTQEANSAIDSAVGNGGNNLTGGTILESGYASGDVPSLSIPSGLLIRVGIDIDGTQDVFALAIQTFSGTDSFVGSLNILEQTCG